MIIYTHNLEMQSQDYGGVIYEDSYRVGWI